MIDLFMTMAKINTITVLVLVLLSLVDAELVFRVDATESAPVCLVGATKPACSVTLNSRYRASPAPAHAHGHTTRSHSNRKLFSVSVETVVAKLTDLRARRVAKGQPTRLVS